MGNHVIISESFPASSSNFKTEADTLRKAFGTVEWAQWLPLIIPNFSSVFTRNSGSPRSAQLMPDRVA